MKIETLTYEAVRDQIAEMVAAGEKITVRNVRARVGGKMAVIADYVKQWHLEQRININEDSFSAELKRAIVIDRKKAINEAIASYNLKYVDLLKVLAETEELLGEKEDAYKKSESELKSVVLKADNTKVKLETQIQGLEKSQAELKKQLEALQNKMDTVTNDKHAAIKDSAVWESKYNELLKQKNKK